MTNQEQATTIEGLWDVSADSGNPAGPLFSGGQFAAADIIASNFRDTHVSACSGSYTIWCC